MGQRRPISRPARRSAAALALVLAAALTSCGAEDSQPATTAPPGRTADAVATLLLAPEALGEGWSTLDVPPDQGGIEGGVVTDDNRELLPRFEQCAASDEQPQSEPLHWDAFRQVNLATPVPGRTGSPGPGVRPTHHLVFVQEYVLTDTPSAVTTTFADLEESMAACVGQETTSGDGEAITSEALEVPAVGEAATGLRYTVTEPGGDDGPVWDLRNVAFRDGDLLVALVVVEIASPTIERELDDAAFADIVQAAHDATS
jgi:hypothetical protein